MSNFPDLKSKSRRQGSNLRPHAPKARDLPIDLLLVICGPDGNRTHYGF